MSSAPTARPLLVPPSRLGPNVLARMLAHRGARVVELPALRAAPPSDVARLDAAAGALDGLDWILFSGELAVRGFLERRRALAAAPGLPERLRVAAIGGSAVRALAEHGITAACAPAVHTAAEVTRALGAVAGQRLLLVREETAGAGLPRALAEAGATVSEAAGFRVAVDATAADADRIAAQAPSALALANPAAARFLARALDELGLELRRWLPGVVVAAVGPTTAAAAEARGWSPDLVAGGRLLQLAELLTAPAE